MAAAPCSNALGALNILRASPTIYFMKKLKEAVTLKNQFLIAMPHLENSGFSNTVTYLCEHNDEGAMGIIINRPTEIALADIFKQLDISTESGASAATPIFAGGPVETNRGFILHRSDPRWDASVTIADSISLTTSKDILSAMAAGEGPDDCLVALGYAGWDAGQLEDELANNYWLTVPATTDIIFSTPYQMRLEAAAGLLGINIAQLSMQAGHA